MGTSFVFVWELESFIYCFERECLQCMFEQEMEHANAVNTSFKNVLGCGKNLDYSQHCFTDDHSYIKIPAKCLTKGNGQHVTARWLEVDVTNAPYGGQGSKMERYGKFDEEGNESNHFLLPAGVCKNCDLSMSTLEHGNFQMLD